MFGSENHSSSSPSSTKMIKDNNNNGKNGNQLMENIKEEEDQEEEEDPFSFKITSKLKSFEGTYQLVKLSTILSQHEQEKEEKEQEKEQEEEEKPQSKKKKRKRKGSDDMVLEEIDVKEIDHLFDQEKEKEEFHEVFCEGILRFLNGDEYEGSFNQFGKFHGQVCHFFV